MTLLLQGCFQLKQDKSGFHIVEVPAKQELIIEAAMRPPPPCPRCHPGAEHARAHEELPGPPANPPKQHRSRGKSESQPQDNGMQPSGKATAGSGIGTASSAPPDLAQEVSNMSCPLHASVGLSSCMQLASPQLYQDT